MRLAFVMHPVDDVHAAVAGYRRSGLDELWWPDDDTALLGSADRACVMVGRNPVESELGPGPVYLVSSVDEYHLRHVEASWVVGPVDVPVGRYAAAGSGAALPLRVLDLTGGQRGRHRLFAGR